MLVSLKWLKELVDISLPVPELVDRLDLTGTAVESVKSAGEALDGVVVGLIVTKERHPEADKLWVTSVDVGAEEPLQIVCGAQNFEAGDKVPVALVGATLPNGMAIKKAKLRGVESRGMNCSARELGMGEDHEGLMILPADAPVGMPFAEYRGLSDTILELEITPNRPDCLSVVGVAREIGAVLGAASSVPASTPEECGAPAVDIGDRHHRRRRALPALHRETHPQRQDRPVASVARREGRSRRVRARSATSSISPTTSCSSSASRCTPSMPTCWLSETRAAPRSASVSRVTGEQLTTLDGQKRELAEDVLVITDSSGPIALAGVMGGEATEIHDGTVNILLESACFSPSSISHTSRRLGLFSEASSRFEKIVDRSACVAALDRAASLMAELAGGEVAPGVVDAYPLPLAPRIVTLRHERLGAVIGADISQAEAAAILGRLGCVVAIDGGVSTVTVPSFRPDLDREIDLIEEVLRVWGMERVPSTLPAGRGRIGELTRAQRWRERIGAALRGSGLNETMTYSFADPADLERMRHDCPADELCVELLNPMSGEQATLRRSLLPGLLRSVSYNQHRAVPNVHLYEIGSIFRTAEGRKQPKERSVVGGVLAGAWHAPAWNEPAVPLDFFDGKGVIESLARDWASRG